MKKEYQAALLLFLLRGVMILVEALVLNKPRKQAAENLIRQIKEIK